MDLNWADVLDVIIKILGWLKALLSFIRAIGVFYDGGSSSM